MAHDPAKKDIVLDLDNTLLSAEAHTDFPFGEPGIANEVVKFAIHDMDGYYIVFERPGVQRFLDMLFERYNVSIWTAASKDYALYIIKHIILREPQKDKPQRRLKYILFAYHCGLSQTAFNNSKDLRMLWGVFGLPYTPGRTLIIDDLWTVYEAQKAWCINIAAFNILDKKVKKSKVFDKNAENDRELEAVGKYLEENF
jgi:NLI interacting factor-like phosphatase